MNLLVRKIVQIKLLLIMCLGEPGLDAGGVAREFYTLLCQSIFNPNCGLFLYSSVNQMCVQINPNSGILLGIYISTLLIALGYDLSFNLGEANHLRYFRTAGRILGMYCEFSSFSVISTKYFVRQGGDG